MSAESPPARQRYPVFIARRFVRARHQGFLSLISLLSALSFLVGVMSLIIALALMTGFQEDVIARIFDANSHLVIQRVGAGRLIEDPAAAVARVAAIPGIAAAEPVVHGYAGIVGPAGLLQWTSVSAVDPQLNDQVTGIGRRMAAGSMNGLVATTLSGRPGIVLGEELARKTGVGLGDSVRLLVPRPRLAPWGASVRQPTLEVVGIFATGYQQYDSSWSFVALGTGQELFDAPGAAHWIAARTADLGRLAETKQAVRTALGPDWHAEDVLSANSQFFSALRLEKLLMFLAIGLIVLVAALGVVSTLVLTVMQKLREIGVLVAMGATPRGIQQIFVFQGAAMGVFGTLAGAALGVGLCTVLDRFKLIRLDPEIYYLDHLPFTVRMGDLGLVVGIAIAVSFLATIYPARRAARLDPVEALRRD